MKRFLGIPLIVVLVFSLLSIGLSLPIFAQPSEVWVDDDNCPGPGSGTQADPFCKIQDGIDAVASPGTVHVLAGTYIGDGNRDLDFNGKAIIVKSVDGPGVTIIDCGGTIEHPHRGFYFHSGETSSSVVDGFTIKNGYAPKEPWSSGVVSVGGAIYCTSHSSPTITNNIITENLTDLTFGLGGGIMLWDNCSPTITHNIITKNKASQAGGIYCYNKCVARIANNIISDNDGGWGGGGVKIALWSKPEVINNVITNNTVYYKGGGIHVGNSAPRIINNTIAGNSSGNEGGGMYFWYTKPSTKVINTILWGNIAGSSGNEISQEGSKFTVTYSDISGGWVGNGNISADPMFVDPASGDYHLQSTSPCIDAGTTEVTPTKDVEGKIRPIDGDGDDIAVTDIGAYEYGLPKPTIEAIVDFDPDTINMSGKGQWVSAFIELPEGYDVNDIIVVFIDDEICAEVKWASINDYNHNGISELMVKFNVDELKSILESDGEVELMVLGRLIDGTPFEGTDTVKVVH